MIRRHLGETIDLHTGGIDLLFPRHENEIAQTEACNGVPLARHWYHSEHLLMDGRKMSKSVGNLYTLDDLLEKGLFPDVRPLRPARRPSTQAAQLHPRVVARGGEGAVHLLHRFAGFQRRPAHLRLCAERARR